MMSFKNLCLPVLVGLTISIFSCKKQEINTPALAEFASALSSNNGSYFVTSNPDNIYKVPIGITTQSTVDRVINFSVTSPTGATEGKQYTIDSKSITIPAGKVVDSISIKGLFDGYPTGRKDTLVLNITGGDVAAFTGSSTYTLVVQKYCDVNLAELEGNYNNCFDTQEGSPDYGPYSINVVPGTSASEKGQITMQNFWDVGGDVKVDLNWTDPSNFTTSVADQFLYTDPTYGEARIVGDGTGKFSSCDNSFTIIYKVYVSAGSFGTYTTIVKR